MGDVPYYVDDPLMVQARNHHTLQLAARRCAGCPWSSPERFDFSAVQEAFDQHMQQVQQQVHWDVPRARATRFPLSGATPRPAPSATWLSSALRELEESRRAGMSTHDFSTTDPAGAPQTVVAVAVPGAFGTKADRYIALYCWDPAPLLGHSSTH